MITVKRFAYFTSSDFLTKLDETTSFIKFESGDYRTIRKSIQFPDPNSVFLDAHSSSSSA